MCVQKLWMFYLVSVMALYTISQNTNAQADVSVFIFLENLNQSFLKYNSYIPIRFARIFWHRFNIRYIGIGVCPAT